MKAFYRLLFTPQSRRGVMRRRDGNVEIKLSFFVVAELLISMGLR